MKTLMLLGAAAGVLMGQITASVLAAPIAASVDEPRAYGHVVGDLIERRVRFVLPAGAELPEASLPRKGRIDAWFEVRDVQWHAPRLRGSAGELRMVYQIVNAPREVATVELPPLSLKLAAGESAPVVEVGAWPITVSALTPQAVLARAGLEPMQADIAPEPAATAAIIGRIGLWTVLLAAVSFALATLRYPQLAFWRRRAPFRAAWSDIRRLSRRADADACRAAMARLHAAFDTAAGVAVFADRLEPLYAAQPWLRRASAQVRQFYAWSRSEFFSGSATPAGPMPQLGELLALARTLAQAEARR